MKEIEKADIEIADTGENPEAPHPREMIDLEVLFCQAYIYTILYYLDLRSCFHCNFTLFLGTIWAIGEWNEGIKC